MKVSQWRGAPKAPVCSWLAKDNRPLCYTCISRYSRGPVRLLGSSTRKWRVRRVYSHTGPCAIRVFRRIAEGL
ncbi:hypothetical protein CSUI_005305 [Cystoisospora suis]|uniref:Uncharacterized protein n=1 Tax=Cystoisospora suis TaxID=483139 RepID=A0A2C6KYG1_9APIC|nr:hypothetical protein CSUI_005305 [Cystoisospora suis]